VVSTKHLSEGLVEVQERRTGRVRLLPPAQAVRAVQDLVGAPGGAEPARGARS